MRLSTSLLCHLIAPWLCWKHHADAQHWSVDIKQNVYRSIINDYVWYELVLLLKTEILHYLDESIRNPEKIVSKKLLTTWCSISPSVCVGVSDKSEALGSGKLRHYHGYWHWCGTEMLRVRAGDGWLRGWDCRNLDFERIITAEACWARKSADSVGTGGFWKFWGQGMFNPKPPPPPPPPPPPTRKTKANTK